MPALDRSLIAGLASFQGLTPEQLDDVLSDAQSVRYSKGADVFRQDGEAQSFYILLHGYLRVYRLTPDGQQVVVRHISPGEIFGVAMALGRSTYPATASAVVVPAATARAMAAAVLMPVRSPAWPRRGESPAPR